MSRHPELVLQSAPESPSHASGVPEQVPRVLLFWLLLLLFPLPFLLTPGQSLHARQVVSATPTRPPKKANLHTRDRILPNEAPRMPRRKVSPAE
jgi:hypothetical protein